MRANAILLLLLLIAVLVVGVPIAAQTAIPGTPTVPVIIVATAPPGPTAVPTLGNGCYAPLALPVGGDVFLRGGVNVRHLPSLSGALVNYYADPVILTLDSGPVCADGYNWWHVSGGGEPGWVVEGKPGRYFLQVAIDPRTTNCAAPQDGITIGGQVQAITGSRVRSEPDSTSTVITTILSGMQITVIDGPRCFNGLNWWRVRVPYGNTTALVDGWIAEGYPGEYFVQGLTSSGEIAPQCLAALRLHAGTRAAVTYRDGVPRRLRAAPGTSAAVVANLLDGIAFDVISDESVCADGYNWWQVRIVATGLTGWLAEGAPGNYWFEVFSN
ncbi:MAG: SH3 domain-containing protein [Anaerolineae bacterium]|nr:SH3 domain-containing protein [Anaerolineae bacterium]